jgi:hypothetical protein
MLNQVSYNQHLDEDSTGISWMPDGLSFKILDTTNFAERTLPKFFPKIQYKSFTRQLNIYGFNRVKSRTSPKYGEYYHKFFVRGEPDLCRHMTRQKIKGTGVPRNADRRRELHNWNQGMAKPVVVIDSSTPLHSEEAAMERPTTTHRSRSGYMERPPRAFLPPGAPVSEDRRRAPAALSSAPVSARKETESTTIPEVLSHLHFSPQSIFGDESLEPLPF